MTGRVLWWASAGHRAEQLRAAAGVALGVALAVVLLGLGGGLGQALDQELVGVGGALRVRAPSLSLGGLDLSGGVVPGRRLDPPALAALAALEGVADVQREAWARVPLVLTGRFVGQRVSSEGALLGVEARAVGDPPGWDWRPGQEVPVLAPRALLAVYNGSYAPTHGLPRLSERAVVGLGFTLLAGRSLYGRGEGPQAQLEAEVVGVSAYGGALAAMVPLPVVAWLEAQLGVEEPGRLSAARLVLAPGADPAAVEAAARAQGWAVEAEGGALERAAALARSVQLGLGLGSAAVLAALLLGVAQVQSALLRVRAPELRVLRTLGLGPGALLGGLAVELVLGVGLSAALGLGVGWLGATLLAQRASEALSGWLGLALEVQLALSPPLVLAVLLGPSAVALLLSAPALRRAAAGER